ncbi:enoyl-CoA hydratase-related protein [Methylocapsa sp. S129]|uniref:enoyl-CoA hydratase-related protein n=1 Tax=Methylocapsa sp. S129 TaxID=1641869 RepID=UPI00131B0795|nr:enoyl-CoA hydratase-related protein [Methylocapsa sp. S129]
MTNDDASTTAPMRAAGLPEEATREWAQAIPSATADYKGDLENYCGFWHVAARLFEALPAKPKRNEAERAAAAGLLLAARASRELFLGAHAERLYDELTERCSVFHRLDDLVYAAAEIAPGLTPTRREVAAEAALPQRDKDGVEIDQGLFLAHVLARPRSGEHLCHAMLLPRPESAALAVEFAAKGALDLGAARLTRVGKAVHLDMINPRFLNAEDTTTLGATEIAVDVATLDRTTEIAVMRGVVVENEKYRGRRIFGAGVNLTHLYLGKIPFVWFMDRDLGYLHKVMRGVASPNSVPDDVNGRGVEKPWLAVVDTFAIGGHCQTLLCVDFVLAADDSYLTLPARKEGIIPGFANLRLPRFTGDRIARQAIQYERRLTCNSPDGRLICDEIAPAAEMDSAIARVVEGLTSSGAVSTIGNRRAFRVGQEPLDLFRRYASVFAREQAYCHFSPALIANLERNWDAKNRKI